MTSASQPMTAPSFAHTMREWLTGRNLAIFGAILAGVSFFLPWFRFSAGGTLLSSLSGQQIASGKVLITSEGTELFSGSTLDYLVPAVALLGLVLVVLTIRRGFVTQLEGFAAIVSIGLGVFTLLFVMGQYLDAQDVAEEEGVSLALGYGIIFVALALIGLIVAGVLNTRAVKQRNATFRSKIDAWSFMGPASFLVIVFFVIPAIILLILSLTDLSSANFTSNPFEWNFIGLDNYTRLFSDTFLPKIIGNSFRYVALTLVLFNVGLALALALLTSNINRRAGFFFRILWLLPRITPSVVYIVMWRRFVQVPPHGIINWFLNIFGFERQPYWLTETPWTFVILVNGFVGASFGLIIFSSAIESISKDLFIAAKVDGASTWQIIRTITIPLLKWPLLFVTSYQTLSLLVSFEYILLLTQGGPGLLTTETWSLTAYKRALFTYFGSKAWGYASAWGFLLVVVGAVLAVVYLRVFRFNDLVNEPKIDVL